MATIVSIVGRSNSGKTTLIVKLIAEFKARGYRVATVKHTPQEVEFDKPGKDTWRHIEAGSEATVISSPDKLVMIKPVQAEARLDDIAQILGEDYDIIIAEGFKTDDAPKVEVHRKETGPLLTDLKRLVAIATDEHVDSPARQLPLNDPKPLADLLETGFIKPNKERIALYVNHSPITLTMFPKEIITNVTLAMANSLKGVGTIKSLQLFFGKRD
jgi:molybdopterin-guanine dinucleotide biosynthesis adapter protein